MALLFMDGFDHYATADINEKWSSQYAENGGTIVVDATGGRRSSGALRLGGNVNVTYGLDHVSKTVTPADTTAIVGFAFKPMTAPPAARMICSIRQGGSATTQATLRLNNDLTMYVIKGPTAGGPAVGPATSTPLALGVYQYIEWKIVIGSGTGGATDVWINGVNRLSLTGINTQQAATPGWSVLRFGPDEPYGSMWVGSAGEFMYFDDLYLLDGSGSAPRNAPLGDCRVSLHMPTGAGAMTQWAPSAGTNNTAVDDVTPNDDTDYVASTAVDQIDTFPVPDAPLVGSTLFGVQMNFSMKKMAEGTSSVAPVVRHEGVNRVGSNITPSSATDYTYASQVLPTIPETGEAWTEAKFNAAEFGYKKTV